MEKLSCGQRDSANYRSSRLPFARRQCCPPSGGNAMKRFTSVFYFLLIVSLAPLGAPAQEANSAQAALPKDVYPDSGNRLPAVSAANSRGALQGVAAIRLHGSRQAVR